MPRKFAYLALMQIVQRFVEIFVRVDLAEFLNRKFALEVEVNQFGQELLHQLVSRRIYHTRTLTDHNLLLAGLLDLLSRIDRSCCP